MSGPSDGVLTWRPAATLVGLGWLGAAAAAGWSVLLGVTAADPPGRLLAGVAAVGLAVAALFGTRARPRLRADAGGLTVRGIGGSRHHPWSRVGGIRVLRIRRWGRDTAMLEIDTADPDGVERLLVFGRLELDEDPEDVVAQLVARRPF